MERRPFNGATAFQRWKRLNMEFPKCDVCNLQWGHRLSAMETGATPTARRATTTTFNGATAFQRWKPDGVWRACSARPLPFNGATAFQRWKQGNARQLVCRNGTFNGATAFQRWKPPCWVDSIPPCSPFNGATAFQRWKLLFVARLRHGFMQKRAFSQESVTG